MSFKAEQKCPECDGVIPKGSMHCPVCMLGRAMGESDSLGQTTSMGDSVSVTETAGDSIGAYKLLEKIGEGGFGVVYMAKQEKPVRRQVALKIIKLGMDTKQVVGRFEAERQALAMMEHPCIAKVLDAGSTENGRPYFVMELVHGVPITEFCNENRLTTEERLKLFVKVCNAVQHAHQKGVIHRDLKPSNILVTMHDDEAVPKVIDFGIAKATQHDLTDKTLFTQFRHFLGTPAYMSPEQAQMSGLGVDTRSDIYSLGVLLYELLTGCTPLDLKPAMASGYDEVRRTIREKEPMKPSAFVSQLSGAKQTTLLKYSRTSAGSLHSQLRGDLDWIVMRAIEKDRTRRYETANLLARDVELFLSNEPVSAVAPSAWYLLSKVVRRHKPIFAALALVLPLLVSATGVSVFLYLKSLNTTQNLLKMKEDLQSEIGERVALNFDLQATNDELINAVQRERLGRYASDMTTAQRLIGSRDFAKAERLLNRYRPREGDGEDIREFAWYYLAELIHEQQGEELVEAGVKLYPTCFSPDGNWLLTLSERGAGIWDVRRARKVEQGPDLPEGFGAGAARFSSDGRFLMIRQLATKMPDPGDAFTVTLWRIDGKRFEPLPAVRFFAWPSGNRYNTESAARFVPGTTLLALAAERSPGLKTENNVILYDVAQSQVVKTIPNAGTILDVSPDGKTLITQRWRQDPPETVIWDLTSGKERRVPQLTDKRLNFLKADQILITKDSGRMELRDVETLDVLELPMFPLDRVDVLQASNDGRFFCLRKYLRRDQVFWDSVSGVSVPLPHEIAKLSPDGKLIAHTLPSGRVGLVYTDSFEDRYQLDRLGVSRFLPARDELVLQSMATGGCRTYRLPKFEPDRYLNYDSVFGFEEGDVYWTRSFDGSEFGGSIVRVGGGFVNNEIKLDPEQDVRVQLLRSGNLLLRYSKPNLLELRDRRTLKIIQQESYSVAERDLTHGTVVEDFKLFIPLYGLRDSIAAISTETLQVVEERRFVRYLNSERRLVVFFQSGKVQEYSMPEMNLADEYDIGPSVRRANISPDGLTIAVARRLVGDGALELISRRSRFPLMSIGIEDGLALSQVSFMQQKEVLVAFLNNGREVSVRWFPAPRGE